MEHFVSEIERSLRPNEWISHIVSWIPDVVSALLIMALFYGLWRLANHAATMGIKRSKLDPTAASFIRTLIKYTLLTIGMVTALGKIGINTASILTSLGVAGLTIGFAAKDALSNMISGIFIFWDRPFVIGDLVEISGQYGRVENITLRSTRVVTPDGRMLAVPNNEIVNSTVASYTNFPHLRLDIDFTIGVGEKIDQVRTIALKLVEQKSQFMTEPKPVVVVQSLNDYNVAMQLRVWLSDERNHVSERHRLREELFESLRNEDIDMPYETLSLAPDTVDKLSGHGGVTNEKNR